MTVFQTFLYRVALGLLGVSIIGNAVAWATKGNGTDCVLHILMLASLMALTALPVRYRRQIDAHRCPAPASLDDLFAAQEREWGHGGYVYDYPATLADGTAITGRAR
ncbi:hypothetical protein ACAG26_24170 [Mycobacterium sp. pUA109]|uniref:hypothetical protein n=1 Tax=Mycobacterium sp. pUA109 TaxID=3238982 RepID=UPI00351B686E